MNIGKYELTGKNSKGLLACIKRPFTLGEFNDASALGRSFYWCQALHLEQEQGAPANARILELATGLTSCRILTLHY